MKIAVDREAETKVVAVKETTLSGFSSSSDTHNTKSVQQSHSIVKDWKFSHEGEILSLSTHTLKGRKNPF